MSTPPTATSPGGEVISNPENNEVDGEESDSCSSSSSSPSLTRPTTLDLDSGPPLPPPRAKKKKKTRLSFTAGGGGGKKNAKCVDLRSSGQISGGGAASVGGPGPAFTSRMIKKFRKRGFCGEYRVGCAYLLISVVEPMP